MFENFETCGKFISVLICVFFLNYDSENSLVQSIEKFRLELKLVENHKLFCVLKSFLIVTWVFKISLFENGTAGVWNVYVFSLTFVTATSIFENATYACSILDFFKLATWKIEISTFQFFVLRTVSNYFKQTSWIFCYIKN